MNYSLTKMEKAKRGLIKRPCSKCGKKFLRTSRFNEQCEECRINALKNRKPFEHAGPFTITKLLQTNKN